MYCIFILIISCSPTKEKSWEKDFKIPQINTARCGLGTVPEDFSLGNALKIIERVVKYGEWIPTQGQMHFKVFPRIAAFREVGWTEPQNKKIEEFKNELKNSRNTGSREEYI